MTQDTFTTGPAGVFARIEHDGQQVTVVKIQDELPASTPELRQELTRRLHLAPQVRSNGSELEQGPAQDLYDKYLSTNIRRRSRRNVAAPLEATATKWLWKKCPHSNNPVPGYSGSRPKATSLPC